VYNLDLPVDLVVLSACNTGLGKPVAGEGLIGLTRAFVYAGAARVVATYWKVDDDATADLIGYFYEQMLVNRKSPAAALRESQISMWRQRRWHLPYYWAAFAIQGEYEVPLDLPLPARHQAYLGAVFDLTLAISLTLSVLFLARWFKRKERG